MHQALHELSLAGDADVQAATVMPDHVHILMRLGNRLSLDRVVAKLKARARPSVAGVFWQPDYFEHRLRDTDDAEAYAWYVFMNPYAAGLCSIDHCWRGWWSSDETARWGFLDLARPGPVPQPEWLDQVDMRFRELAIGDP